MSYVLTGLLSIIVGVVIGYLFFLLYPGEPEPEPEPELELERGRPPPDYDPSITHRACDVCSSVHGKTRFSYHFLFDAVGSKGREMHPWCQKCEKKYDFCSGCGDHMDKTKSNGQMISQITVYDKDGCYRFICSTCDRNFESVKTRRGLMRLRDRGVYT